MCRSTQRSSGDSSVHSAVLSNLSQDCILCVSSSSISVNSLSFRRLSNLHGSRKKPRWSINLRLLFSSGHSQSHGHRQVVGDASQLGNETELLHFLRERGKTTVNKSSQSDRPFYPFFFFYKSLEFKSCIFDFLATKFVVLSCYIDNMFLLLTPPIRQFDRWP